LAIKDKLFVKTGSQDPVFFAEISSLFMKHLKNIFFLKTINAKNIINLTKLLELKA